MITKKYMKSVCRDYTKIKYKEDLTSKQELEEMNLIQKIWKRITCKHKNMIDPVASPMYCLDCGYVEHWMDWANR